MSQQERKILIATHNQGKVREYEELLTSLEVAWLGLQDAGIEWDVEETGATFEENAILKARSYSRVTDLLTLADDSGLEVDALGGRPGVYTARFGGPDLSSVDRYNLLLQEMAGVAPAQRTARFHCVVAIAQSGLLQGTAKGVVEGRIALAPSGAGGFGYDPIFYLPEQKVTMAQLPSDIKNEISHRSRALAAVKPLLQALLAE